MIGECCSRQVSRAFQKKYLTQRALTNHIRAPWLSLSLCPTLPNHDRPRFSKLAMEQRTGGGDPRARMRTASLYNTQSIDIMFGIRDFIVSPWFTSSCTTVNVLSLCGNSPISSRSTSLASIHIHNFFNLFILLFEVSTFSTFSAFRSSFGSLFRLSTWITVGEELKLEKPF